MTMEEALEADARKLQQLTGRDHARLNAEANVFALYLLMPTDLLEVELSKIGPKDIDDEAWMDGLAKKFKVTRGTLSARLRLYAQDYKHGAIP